MQNTEKNITNIKFPVFLIGENGTISKQGDEIIYTSWRGKEGVVDDLSLPGDFTSRRNLLRQDTIKHLGIALYFYQDLIKFKNPQNIHFIDSDGNIFKFKKSKLVKLSFHKIDHWIRVKNQHYILVKLEGFSNYFKSLMPPKSQEWFAGILHITKKQLLLYGFFDKKYDTTIRKV